MGNAHAATWGWGSSAPTPKDLVKEGEYTNTGTAGISDFLEKKRAMGNTSIL